MVLGCYFLYCVGVGLWNFGDAGNAAEELAKVRSRDAARA